MLFNSYAFLLAFLPLSLVGYFFSTKAGPRVALLWLAVCSLGFYAYWNPAFLVLIIGSIIFNFTAGHLISKAPPGRYREIVFVSAIAANLLLLVFFKYLGPLVNFLAPYGGLKTHLDIILPLGISFFTFTQIGYLVDRRDGIGEDMDALRYTVFVTFFPHLIAGPILHIREIGPQLLDREALKLRFATFAPGLSMFAIGLFKKVLIADPLGNIANIGFGNVGHLTLLSGWFTATAYMAELYFDFSGYSDMAVGLAGMFGIRFPINFNSPYKSRGIIEFWQRFHMTLSRYLALLLYNPVALWVTRRRVAKGLKVSQKALAKPGAFLSMVAFPTFFTMGLAGIWHGAGLQYLVFGLLHASYLTINHAWRVFGPRKKAGDGGESLGTIIWKVGLTQLAVMLGLIFFRSDSCASALQLVGSMLGTHGVALTPTMQQQATHLGGLGTLLVKHFPASDTLFIVGGGNALRIALAFGLAWFAPNSQQILNGFAPVLESVALAGPSWLRWRPNLASGAVTALLLWWAFMNITRSTTFLYFQF